MKRLPQKPEANENNSVYTSDTQKRRAGTTDFSDMERI